MLVECVASPTAFMCRSPTIGNIPAFQPWANSKNDAMMTVCTVTTQCDWSSGAFMSHKFVFHLNSNNLHLNERDSCRFDYLGSFVSELVLFRLHTTSKTPANYPVINWWFTPDFTLILLRWTPARPQTWVQDQLWLEMDGWIDETVSRRRLKYLSVVNQSKPYKYTFTF